MNKPQPDLPPDTEGGPEVRKPGERSGEGSSEIFRHIQRDIRRQSGLVPERHPQQDEKG